MSALTHLDEDGAARMVDVGGKAVTTREAVAQGRITMSPEAAAAIRTGAVTKGDVLAVARVAGIMAAKRTADLIPLCHPLPLTRVTVDLDVVADVLGPRLLCVRRWHRQASGKDGDERAGTAENAQSGHPMDAWNGGAGTASTRRRCPVR